MNSDDHELDTASIKRASTASRRKFAGRLSDDIVSTPAPLLALAAYATILLIPEQSVEALRTVFDYPTWLLFLTLFIWLALLAYFASALVCSTVWAFQKRDELAGIQTKTSFEASSIRTCIIWIVSLAPVAITIAFVWLAFASNPGRASGPLLFSIFYAVFGLMWSYGSVTQASKTGYKEFLGSTVTYALVTFAIIGLLAVSFTRVIFSQDLPVVLLIVVWITVLLAALHVLEWLSLRSGWPILTTIVVLTVLFSVSDLNDNHVLRTLDASGSRQPQDIVSVFDGWVSAHKKDIEAYAKENRRYPAFVFVAEGGGIRAAPLRLK